MEISRESKKLYRIVGTSEMMMRKCDEAIASFKVSILELDPEDEYYEDDKYDLRSGIAAQEQLKRAYESMIDIVNSTLE